MLPWWFAEYTLYFGLAALLLFIAVVVFGYVAPTTDRLAPLLSDMSRTRRPSIAISVVALPAGIIVLGLGIGASTSHLGLVMSAIGSFLLLLGISAGGSLPIRTLWTNEFWKLPSPDAMTLTQARALGRVVGRVYVVLGVGCVIAVVGGLVGIIPKLIYVGEPPIPTVFLVADFVLIAMGGIVVFRAWRLFQSVQVHRAHRAPTHQRR